MTIEEAKEQDLVCDEFKKKYNFHEHEKCCSTCKWLRVDKYDLADTWCIHPELKIKNPIFNLYTWYSNVCDAWEKR